MQASSYRSYPFYSRFILFLFFWADSLVYSGILEFYRALHIAVAVARQLRLSESIFCFLTLFWSRSGCCCACGMRRRQRRWCHSWQQFCLIALAFGLKGSRAAAASEEPKLQSQSQSHFPLAAVAVRVAVRAKWYHMSTMELSVSLSASRVNLRALLRQWSIFC